MSGGTEGAPAPHPGLDAARPGDALPPSQPSAAPRTLRIASPWMLAQPRLRRMLALAGWRMRPGLGLLPGAMNGVWGRKPWSRPGRIAAALSPAGLLTVEDGFLRSVQPGVTGEAALSLTLDDLGVYHDASRPSRLERLIESGADLDDALRARAAAGVARLRTLGLSKYTPVPRGAGALPDPGYVLVIDQTAGDASIAGGGATAASFRAMLAAARAENPEARIVIRTHPDVTAGARQGHFGPTDADPRTTLLDRPANPWDLIEGAARVYAVTSQMGFEAALAGHRTVLFGQPFYAGWGFTDDRAGAPARRTARRSAVEVFAASHLLFPIYHDPFADRRCSFEETVETLAAIAPRRASDLGATGAVYAGFGRWKHAHMPRFGPHRARPPVFEDDLARAARTARDERRRLHAWASRYPDEALRAEEARGTPVIRVEDGFLRSVGLGAALIDAASLVFDPDGIYYDPAHPSRIETLIAEAAGFAPGDPRLARARTLVAQILRQRVTKYNLAGAGLPEIPADARVLLVPGQVEDDASIRRGTSHTRTNRALLDRARAENPDAFLVYKPHPDVEAGLRDGAVPDADTIADAVARRTDPVALLDRADALWTMTSLMGFEALLRGVPVTTLGAPFYAGWGLTTDLGHPPARRAARPTLDALAWAALIAYPDYVDPVSGLPATPEQVVARLAQGDTPPRTPARRLTSRAQDLIAALGLRWWD